MYGELLETLLPPKQKRRRSHLTMKAPAEQTIKQLYQYQDRRVYPSLILHPNKMLFRTEKNFLSHHKTHRFPLGYYHIYSLWQRSCAQLCAVA